MIEIDKITNSLDNPGFRVIDRLVKPELVSLIDELGEVVNSTRINYSSSSRAQLASRNEMSLHTDSWSVDIIAWYCISEAESGGNSILIDTRKILASLDEKDKTILRKILLPDGLSIKNKKINNYHPILTSERIFYANWLISTDLVGEERRAIERWQLAIDESEKVSINLKAGQCLIINNRWILHGRSSFEDGDRVRNLIRFWIKNWEI